MISAQVGLPATPPDAPGLFRCAAPDAIGRVFRDTGMHDVAETDVHGFSEPASAKDYCTYLSDGGPRPRCRWAGRRRRHGT